MARSLLAVPALADRIIRHEFRDDIELPNFAMWGDDSSRSRIAQRSQFRRLGIDNEAECWEWFIRDIGGHHLARGQGRWTGQRCCGAGYRHGSEDAR
jgi:hypothetical protein